MHHKKELSYSAQNMFLSPLTHFISINDVTINRKKIKKLMSESENNMNILTTIERRERIFTLLIIAFISLLTGKIIFIFSFL